MNIDKISKLIIFSIIIITVIYIAAVIFIGLNIISMDWSGGLRPILEKIWCGSDHCM